MTRTHAIEWGVAAAALPGQPRSGDCSVVQPFPSGVLIAVVDGIGHGEEAATAAAIACTFLQENASAPPIVLIQRCHEELRATRGAVMSLASIDITHGLMTWLGVGNVQAILLRADTTNPGSEESLLLRGGVVGDRLPALQASVLPVSRGDALVLVTDGIEQDFRRSLALGQHPQKSAEGILARHAKASDDALALVARYWGDGR